MAVNKERPVSIICIYLKWQGCGGIIDKCIGDKDKCRHQPASAMPAPGKQLICMSEAASLACNDCKQFRLPMASERPPQKKHSMRHLTQASWSPGFRHSLRLAQLRAPSAWDDNDCKIFNTTLDICQLTHTQMPTKCSQILSQWPKLIVGMLFS